jgi:osmoprotectant transport system substrate-binding protein
MSYKSLSAIAMCLVPALLLAACNRTKPIVVGSTIDTAQALAAEIVAQHLERRLNRKIERRLNAGDQSIVYQTVTSGQITIYPDSTGSILTGILKESADPQPAVALERARSEILRVAQLELMDPLGYQNPSVIVVRAADVQAQAKTLSEAAAGAVRWKLGLSYEFQQRLDGLTALNTYKLPLAQPVSAMEANRLYPALQSGELTMISSTATDGHLTAADLQVLEDDNHVFPPAQACLLVRVDAFAAEPRLRTVLTELSGKFTTEAVRTMAAQVDLDHRDPVQVASEFLTRAGLK